VALAAWIMLAPLSVLGFDEVQVLAATALLERCDPVRVVVFGDSRPIFGIDPGSLDTSVVILAEGNASPVVDQYRLQQRLACARKPDLVILSYILPAFVRVNANGFWTNGAFTHGLGLDEQWAVMRAVAPGLFQPMQTDAAETYAELPFGLKTVLYRSYFPVFYGPSVLNAQQTGLRSRLESNERVRDLIMAGHGHLEGRMAATWPEAALDVGLPDGGMNRVIDADLRHMLDLLAGRGIRSLLLLMPVNEATYAGIPASARAAVMGSLQALIERYPLTRLADRDLPHWPDRFFGDLYMHMNKAGTAAVSAILNACLPGELDRSGPGCSLAEPGGEAR
jgi:hypothetical protein